MLSMALYTRKQLAGVLGLDWENKSDRDKIGMWVKRNNLHEVNNLIDDTNQQNEYWIQKQSKKVTKVGTKDSSVTESVKIATANIEPTVSKEKKAKSKDKSNNAALERFELDTEKRIKEIEKLEVDIRLQELKEEKIRGEVIPIVLSTQLFMTHNQSIVTAQKDGIEMLLINIAKECRLTGDQLAKLRGKMVDILNDAVDKSITITQKKIKSLVDEFSIKKEVGEKE